MDPQGQHWPWAPVPRLPCVLYYHPLGSQVFTESLLHQELFHVVGTHRWTQPTHPCPRWTHILCSVHIIRHAEEVAGQPGNYIDGNVTMAMIYGERKARRLGTTCFQRAFAFDAHSILLSSIVYSVLGSCSQQGSMGKLLCCVNCLPCAEMPAPLGMNWVPCRMTCQHGLN